MMQRRHLLLTPTLLPLFGQATQPTGKTLFNELLAAFNDSDSARLRAFLEKRSPALLPRIDGLLGTRGVTGGFEFIRFDKDEGGQVEATVKEKLSDGYARLSFRYEGEKVDNLGMRRIPRPEGIAGPTRLPQKEAIRALAERAESETKSDRFSGAVLIARHGSEVYKGAFGLADREKNTANEVDTKFRIGSMNKMFTSTATLQLVSKGKLALTDPIGKHLKDYPNQDLASKVTVRHLLTHTGGTGDIFGPQFDEHRLTLKTADDYVKLYGARALEFEPGSKWRYSNYGFLLLGALIEKVTGESYYEVVRKNVFEPVQMSNSSSEPETVKVPKRSQGYMRKDGTWVSNGPTLPWRGTSAGGGYSTVEDLARFGHGLTSGKLLDKALVEAATSKQAETGGGPGSYGFGMIIRGGQGDEPLNFGHGGGAPGMNGELRIYPKSGTLVAILANLDPPAASRLADFYEARMPLGD